jgi:hypothetical protein
LKRDLLRRAGRADNEEAETEIDAALKAKIASVVARQPRNGSAMFSS